MSQDTETGDLWILTAGDHFYHDKVLDRQVRVKPGMAFPASPAEIAEFGDRLVQAEPGADVVLARDAFLAESLGAVPAEPIEVRLIAGDHFHFDPAAGGFDDDGKPEGAQVRIRPGETFMATPAEIAMFGDRFEIIAAQPSAAQPDPAAEEPAQVDGEKPIDAIDDLEDLIDAIANMTIDDVLLGVAAGAFTAADALAAEESGKARKTLIGQLSAMVN